MPRLVHEPQDKLHVFSLLVRSRLESALSTVEGRDIARKLSGRVGLAAGAMETGLTFDGRTVRMDQGAITTANARATGTLASFLAICQGKIRMGDILRGQVRVSGNLLLLRRFFPLLSVGVPDEQD